MTCKILFRKPAFVQSVCLTALATCTTPVVWGQEPVGNGNFSNVIRADPSGHYELVEHVICQAVPPGHRFHLSAAFLMAKVMLFTG